MSHVIVLTGLRFGRLVVKARGERKASSTQATWICQCDCGNVCTVIGQVLRLGHTQSCGCIHSEMVAARNRKNKTHGLTINGITPEYRAWSALKNRCYNKSNKDFRKYGGRGISVCQRWADSFMAFFEDMGPRPSKRHSIDRINNDGNYEPGNCRWATPKEQVNNRRCSRRRIVP
jgi:hypothetical protein